MRSEFSEFSYGFAALNELVEDIGRTHLSAAPVLPTLRRENVLGYDARIDTLSGVLFLQFKTAIRLTTARAKQWDDYGVPYFAFELRNNRYSPQHDVLCDLQAALPIAAMVAYVAPAFRTGAAFNRHFGDHAVLDHSLWVRPLALGRTARGSVHRVCYRDADDRPRRYSKDPVVVEELLPYQSVVATVTEWPPISGMSLSDGLGTVASALREALPRPGRPSDDVTQDIRRMAWSVDLHVVFVGSARFGDRLSS